VEFGEILLDHVPMDAYEARIVHTQGGRGSGGASTGAGVIVLTAAHLGAVAQAEDGTATEGAPPIEGPTDTEANPDTGTEPGETAPKPQPPAPSTSTKPTTESHPSDGNGTVSTTSSTPNDVVAPVAVLDRQQPLPVPSGQTAAEFASDLQTIVQQANAQLDSPTLSECINKVGGPCDAALLLTAIVAVDSEGQPVTPDVAARKLVKLLRSVRKAGDGTTQNPAGVLVTAELRSVNQKGKHVSVRWSMYDEEQRLDLPWTSTHQSLTIIPRRTPDPVIATLWLPLPKPRGNYNIRLDAYVDGQLIDSARTDRFR
jgi:hypothetical protein